MTEIELLEEILEEQQQTNYYLDNINGYLISIDTGVGNELLYYNTYWNLLNNESGDFIPIKQVNDFNYSTSVYLGCINLILMVTLLLSLLPFKKGVANK